MALDYKVSEKSSRFMVPAGGSGNIDVVNDFSWTKSPKFARKDVPYIEMTEYQQTTGKLIASLLYYTRLYNTTGLTNAVLGNTNPQDVFKLKYIAEPTGFSYRFPYFSPHRAARATSFPEEDHKGPFTEMSKIGGYIPGISGIFGKLAGIGASLSGIEELGNSIVPGKLSMDTPRQWDGTHEEKYEISFDLSNSLSVSDIIQNVKLVELLQYQQSPFRRGVAIIDPTCIYSVNIPGVTNMPAAYIPSLKITDLGNKRIMRETGIAKPIPDAFRIQLTVESLFLPYRNILEAVYKGQTVQAIGDVDFNSVDSIASITGRETAENIIRTRDLLKNTFSTNNIPSLPTDGARLPNI